MVLLNPHLVIDAESTSLHRRRAVALAYERLVVSVAAGAQPEDDDVALLLTAIADAAVARDREVAITASRTSQLLADHLGGDEAWRHEWRGRMWALAHLSAMAAYITDHRGLTPDWA